MENSACARCGKKQAGQAKDKNSEAEDILPTGRTFKEQKEYDLQNVMSRRNWVRYYQIGALSQKK